MSVQKLLELQPGNLLELDVHPENGVDLVVNGSCIARGRTLAYWRHTRGSYSG